jgi:hypothetical protein
LATRFEFMEPRVVIVMSIGIVVGDGGGDVRL